MRTWLFTPATLLAFIASTLYWFGRVKLATQNQFLKVADFAAGVATYQDTLFNGFIQMFTVFSFGVVGYMLFYIIRSDLTSDRQKRPEPRVLQTLWRSYTKFQRVVMIIALVLFPFSLHTASKLSGWMASHEDQALFCLSASDVTEFNEWSTCAVCIWVFFFFAGSFLAAHTWRVLASEGRVTVLVAVAFYVFVQTTIFAGWSGFDAARSPKPEIDVGQTTEPLLKGTRAFLLGVLPNVYVLLTVEDRKSNSNHGAVRTVVLAKDTQLPSFKIKGYKTLFQVTQSGKGACDAP